jgi:hypothetical protein
MFYGAMVCRLMDRMKIVVHLLNVVDRLSFLQAVVHEDKTTIALQPQAIHLVPRNLFLQQPHAYSVLKRLARYLTLCLKLLRRRTLELHGQEEEQNTKVVSMTRELAYDIAMAHEVHAPSSSVFCGRCILSCPVEVLV